MKCNDCRDFLIAYSEGVLDEEQRSIIKNHLEGCEYCREVLEEYESIKGPLHTLDAVSSLPDPKEDIYSAIDRLETDTTNRRHWLRPAAIALPVILLLAVVLPISLTSGASSLLAKAAAATEDLRSFQSEKDEYYQWTEADELTFSHHIECKFTEPDQYHFLNETKPHQTSYAYIAASSTELILIDDQVYSKGTILRQDREYFNQLNPTEALTSGYVNTLVDIETLEDEIIDDVLCSHIKGTVDPEKLLDFMKPNFRNIHKRHLKNGIAITEDFDEWFTYWETITRNEVITLEFWIGKTDYIFRQWKETITPGENYPGSVTAFYYAECYGRVFNLNEEIVIDPPLDDNDELLPGWMVNPLLD